jgi:hypothetical protein
MVSERKPATPEGAPYVRVRAAPGWQSLPVGHVGRRAILHGHRLPFKRRVQKVGFHQPVSRRLDEEHVGERVVEVKRLLGTGALVAAPVQEAAELVRRGHMICPAFMVSKKGTRKKRLVYNQKRLNAKIRKKRVKLESMKMVREIARPGDWAYSMDVGAEPNGKDAYHMVEIAPPDQKYMTVDLGDAVHRASLGQADRQAVLDQAGVDVAGLTEEEIQKVWGAVPRFVMCSAMPFGYTNAPFLLTKVLRAVVEQLRGMGVRCIVYMDDLILFASTEAEALEQQPQVEAVLRRFGVKRQESKGEWTPRQGTADDPLEHLGVGLNLRTGVFYVPVDRMKRIRQQARALLSSQAKHQGQLDMRWLAEFAGLVMSCHLPVPSTRYRTRPFFDDLVRGQAYQRKFRGYCRISRESLRCIRWWRDLAWSPDVGRLVWPPPVDMPMTVDASTSVGWGANLGAQPLTGSATQDVGLPAAGIWSVQEKQLSITHLELRAVRLALTSFRKYIGGRSLLIWEDNVGVMHMLNNFACSSAAMRADLLAVMEILESENAVMRARYVQSASNPSDYFSRIPNKGEWVLHPDLAAVWMRQFGRCTVDRFADWESAQLPRFNSPYPCRGSEAVDAFTVSWEGERSWVNPPWRLISRICSKLQAEPGAAATLLVPVWPSQPWWPVLMQLADGWTDVVVPADSVRASYLAEELAITPEVVRVVGRSDRMRLVSVPFRG